MTEKVRCDWAIRNPLERAYHDNEWGIPEYDDQALFELLLLETMQAGLSWATILAKRDSLSQAFDHFQPEVIQNYQEDKLAALLQDPGVIRHQGKIRGAVTNAQLFIEIQKEYGSFATFIWDYVAGEPINNHWETIAQVPSSTELSVKISQELKRRGFKFTGPTTVYSFLQASGIVNDHLVSCFKK